MYTVYILEDANGRVYKGMTQDLARRLKEHRAGHTKTTRSMKDLVVVYTEEFQNSKSARQREVYFKSAAGRLFLKKLRARSSAG